MLAYSEKKECERQQLISLQWWEKDNELINLSETKFKEDNSEKTLMKKWRNNDLIHLHPDLTKG